MIVTQSAISFEASPTSIQTPIYFVPVLASEKMNQPKAVFSGVAPLKCDAGDTCQIAMNGQVWQCYVFLIVSS